MTSRLALTGLHHAYPRSDQPSLESFDLDVAAGEVVCVVGPSGAGKTTLLRLVGGLLAPTAGRVAIDDADVTALPPERRAVAMVFQGFALFPHLTVAENIRFGLRVRREPHQLERVREVAALLELTDLLDRRPAQLSGGERQRTALGRALVRDPAVFCLDEPLASLDPSLRADARRLLGRVLRADGRGALVVTHDQAEALTLGDRVAILNDGRLEQVGTPEEVYARPATPFVAGFVGTPPATVVPADGALAAALGAVGRGQVAVRAEHVRLGRQGVPGTVVESAHLGALAQVTVDVADGSLVATMPTHTAPAVGGSTRVRVDAEHLLRYDEAGRLQ